jgi:hypothetical protein
MKNILYDPLKFGFWLCLAVCFFGISCSNKYDLPLEISFYYWKQSFELNTEQQSLINSCRSKQLFVKFFDVIVDPNTGEIKPISKIDFNQQPQMNVVPCIFIQNDVFKRDIDLDTISKNIIDLTYKIAIRNNLDVSEIQIDCDWTESTQEKYFKFLGLLQSETLNCTITPTIRLHQIKYKEKTGVPPSKKGLLMCYNMGDIESFNTKNSILSSDILETYISNQTTYPMELDLALPIFQWALIYRLGALTTIDNDISREELSSPFFNPIEENKFQVPNFTSINETEYCKGDLVRFEETESSELLKCAEILKNSGLKFNKVIFYHISQNNLYKFKYELLQEISSIVN